MEFHVGRVPRGKPLGVVGPARIEQFLDQTTLTINLHLEFREEVPRQASGCLRDGGAFVCLAELVQLLDVAPVHIGYEPALEVTNKMSNTRVTT